MQRPTFFGKGRLNADTLSIAQLREAWMYVAFFLGLHGQEYKFAFAHKKCEDDSDEDSPYFHPYQPPDNSWWWDEWMSKESKKPRPKRRYKRPPKKKGAKRESTKKDEEFQFKPGKHSSFWHNWGTVEDAEQHLPGSTGIETPRDLAYLFAHGCTINLTREAEYATDENGHTKFKKGQPEEIPGSVTWKFEIGVPVDMDGEVRYRSCATYSDAVRATEDLNAQGQYTYDKYNPNFRGVRTPKEYFGYFKSRTGVGVENGERAEMMAHNEVETARCLQYPQEVNGVEYVGEELHDALARRFYGLRLFGTVDRHSDEGTVKVKSPYMVWQSIQRSIAGGYKQTKASKHMSQQWFEREGRWIPREEAVKMDLKKSVADQKEQKALKKAAGPKESYGGAYAALSAAAENPEETRKAKAGGKKPQWRTAQHKAADEADRGKVFSSGPVAPQKTKKQRQNDRRAQVKAAEAEESEKKQAANKNKKKCLYYDGTEGSCRHGDKCRFSHDLVAEKACPVADPVMPAQDEQVAEQVAAQVAEKVKAAEEEKQAAEQAKDAAEQEKQALMKAASEQKEQMEELMRRLEQAEQMAQVALQQRDTAQKIAGGLESKPSGPKAASSSKFDMFFGSRADPKKLSA